MLIFTCVNDKYAGFIPLFKYSLSKKHPSYSLEIERTGSLDGIKTATKRFITQPKNYEGREFILITDVDILFNDENILDMRLDFMEKNRLKCYSNSPIDNKGAFPGVHFVTNEWYRKTYYWRRFYNDYLIRSELKKTDDEKILGDIIYKSSLKIPTPSGIMSHHGFHLGCLRDRNYNENNLPDAPIAKEYLNDKDFMKLVDESTCPIVNKVFTKLKTIFKM